MGCPELNITDYYRITDTTCRQNKYLPASESTKKTANSRFFPVVSVLVPNYRYYSPELGRWLSRDPLYERGSVAWFKFNREDEIRRKINELKDTLDFLNEIVLFKYLTKLKNSIEQKTRQSIFYLRLKLLKSLTGNAHQYLFIGNSPINSFDYLGMAEATNGEGINTVCECVCGVTNFLLRAFGVLWNYPNFMLGHSLGMLSVLFGATSGESIDGGPYTVAYYNSSFMPFGALTLGESIHYPGNQTSGFGPNYPVDGGHPLGEHEGAHIPQNYVLGPFYLPLHITSQINSIMISLGQYGLSLTGLCEGPGYIMGWGHNFNLLEIGPSSDPATPWPWAF